MWKLTVILNILSFLALTMLWTQKDWANFIVRLFFIAMLIGNIMLALHLDGCIIKIH